MNKRQKEVQQQILNREKAVLSQLERNYRTALNDINQRIEQLLSRQDADMQHVIYQVEYQKALRSEVQGILARLQANEFTTISAYLTAAYEDGFVGTMYDLHGQGVPVISEIDERQVAEAVQHETPLSQNLYTSLGKDVKEMQKQIAAEISRGIATSLPYADIARNIAAHAGISKNKAMRIARTEAHRIQNKAAFDAQHKASDAGASVVKQWDAALDGRTRKSHRKLDGQIRELDEPFEVDGKKAMYPGGFGRPEEDIHCRCVSNQRAKWALDEDELKILQERAEYFGLDKAKSFEEFQKKYLRVSNDIENKEYKQWGLEDFKKNKHKITKEERKIIYGKGHFSGYINSSNAKKLNGLLRAGQKLPEYYGQISETLQEIIDRNTINDDIIVTRYVTGDALESITGVKLPVANLKTNREAYFELVEQLPSKIIKKGLVYTEKGFLSTSAVMDKNVMTRRTVMLNIKIPKGTNCYITTNNKESEIILGKNTNLKIVNSRIENNRTANFKVVIDCMVE